MSEFADGGIDRSDFGRRDFLKMVGLFAVPYLLNGCAGDRSQPSARTTESSPARNQESGTNRSTPVDAYVENWLTGDEYASMRHAIPQGSLRRLNIAFALPNAKKGVLLDPTSPELLDYISSQDAKLSLSIGGYGDESAEPESTFSRKSVTSGWVQAMQDPATFARATVVARKQIAAEVGRPYGEIGLDIDCEYPGASNKVAFTGLVRALRGSLHDTPLTIAVPSHDNLGGYDIPKLAGLVDGINVMTYANGDEYSPDDAVSDMQHIAELARGDGKLSVGFSTDRAADPKLWTPLAMTTVRKGLANAGIQPAASFVWSTDGLTQQHLHALHA